MKNFKFRLISKIIILIAFCFGLAYFTIKSDWSVAFIFLGITIIVGVQLYKYVTGLNRKINRLFESIQYQDFAITFKSDNDLGESFKDLNEGLNAVIHSFNLVRAERESTLQFLQVLIQQVNVGMLSYTTEGTIEIANQAASKLIGIYRLSHLKNIEIEKPEVYDIIINLKAGESKLLKIDENELAFSVAEIRLQGRKIRLISIHNIRSELQSRELEAWQNLTKVLRHEIMNSVTPIVSLVETMQEIAEHDLVWNTETEKEAIEDLKISLKTVRRRGNGIMRFVNAYREFTSVPSPKVESVLIVDLLNNIERIFNQNEVENNIKIKFEVDSNISLIIDKDQIEQVLINLVRNATQCRYDVDTPTIIVKARNVNSISQILVMDNGVGIDKENLDKIFIPFFTTKASGTGIGLSLSRQIMQLHGGRLNFQENKPNGSVFILSFN